MDDITNTPQAQVGMVRPSYNPMLRQLGVMVGIALSVALGVVIVFWSWTPNYSVLSSSLTEKDASEVIAALQQGGIEHKVDASTGAIMVKSQQLQEARLKLAGQGLPRGGSMGFEILQQEAGFGTSRAVEAARFHRALEGELARTISTLSSVASARVHLATPKQSAFVRGKKHASASVVVKLFSGRVLEKGQVAAIVHLVASGVPELEASSVTVVDHKGNLLSSNMDSKEMMLTATQFEYTKGLEEHYRKRAEAILQPIVGEDKVRAGVTVDVDFTVNEQTAERFNPDLPALRSEQVNEQSSSLSAVQGVPGALSNQPPAAGSAPEQATAAEGNQVADGEQPINSSKRATRNYELDKTISHTRHSTGILRKLSIAVVVDDLVTNKGTGAGSEERTKRTPEEIERFTQLVKEAVGFNELRGDSVSVINASFQVPTPPAPLPEPAIWEKPWVWDLAKQIVGVILVLVLVFVVLLPTIKRLNTAPPPSQYMATTGGGMAVPGGVPGASMENSGDALQLPGKGKYEDTLDAARQLVSEDPMRVAQVVRSWVAEDASH